MASPSSNTAPKYLQITESVKRGILAGEWAPGEQLPSCREFTERFGVTPMTVWKALDELGKEDLVFRVQGKGTFVQERQEAKEAGLVGVIFRPEGDSYGQIYSRLLRHLGGCDRHAISTDIPDFEATAEQRLQAMQRFLERDLTSLVVDGRQCMPFPLLQDWLQRDGHRLTFLLRCETAMPFTQANRVVVDWEAGGRLAAEHLLAAGASRLAMLTYRYPGTTGPTLGPESQYHWAIIRGMEAALADAGLDRETAFRVHMDIPGEATDAALTASLREGFDGVLCIGDFRAPRVYRLARALGLEPGRDVRVCGFFDTHWAHILEPALTSIGIHEDVLAQTAVEAIINDWQGETIRVTPVLTPRESTTNSGAAV